MPNIDAAALTQAQFLQRKNRTPSRRAGEENPFPNNPGLAEAFRRGYIDGEGNQT